METKPPVIDAAWLWDAHMTMAAIGPNEGGGSDRPALSAADAEARALLRGWTAPLGLVEERDAIGNMFLRRAGREPEAEAVAFGSHLDTVPTGGRFDGISGVLTGLAVMRALDEAGIVTRRPLELVNWTNEEGSRFRTAMMGSRVHAGAMTLADALAVADDDGVTVADALAATGEGGPLAPAPRLWHAWLELHIEQGPVLEEEGRDIGIVTGTMQARYLQLTIRGAPSHVGPTAMDRRQDSLAAAAEIILAVERIGRAAEPHGRASATWIQNSPNARGAVPAITHLHTDVRHEHEAEAARMQAAVRAEIDAIASRRRVTVDADPYGSFGPTVFDPALGDILREAAKARQLTTRDIIAAAGHDSVLIAPLCPSAMLFVPSRGGITHNPAEYTESEQLARGAEVLLDAVLHLAE